MNDSDTNGQDIWHRTIGGKPKVGAAAERPGGPACTMSKCSPK